MSIWANKLVEDFDELYPSKCVHFDVVQPSFGRHFNKQDIYELGYCFYKWLLYKFCKNIFVSFFIYAFFLLI